MGAPGGGARARGPARWSWAVAHTRPAPHAHQQPAGGSHSCREWTDARASGGGLDVPLQSCLVLMVPRVSLSSFTRFPARRLTCRSVPSLFSIFPFMGHASCVALRVPGGTHALACVFSWEFSSLPHRSAHPSGAVSLWGEVGSPGPWRPHVESRLSHVRAPLPADVVPPWPCLSGPLSPCPSAARSLHVLPALCSVVHVQVGF